MVRKSKPAKRKGNHTVPQGGGLTIQHQIHAGPLPAPEQLQAYNSVVPGLAERIVAHAEREQKHRQAMECRAISMPHREAVIGQVFGLIIGVTGIVAGAWLIDRGHDVAGSLFAGGTLVALVTAFIKGRAQ